MIFISLIIAIGVLPYLWPSPKPMAADKESFQELQQQLAKLKNTDSNNKDAELVTGKTEPFARKGHSKDSIQHLETFYFDPNTLTTDGWKRLGISDRTIHTIQNYLAKGGAFKKPADLAKIYGMRKIDLERLLPYIRLQIPAEQHPAKAPAAKGFAASGSAFVPFRKSIPKTVLEINTADSISLMALPGIGTRLSARIIKFRNQLGGFASVDQVAETFGLPDSTFQKIKPLLKCQPGQVKKININKADLYEMRQHPYLKWNLAKLVVRYREQHGAYNALDQLLNITEFNADLLQKLRPYLVLE